MRRGSLLRIAYFDHYLPPDLIDALWTEPEALGTSAETLRRNGSRWTVQISWSSQKYVLKHYQPVFWNSITQLVRPTRAWLTWSATHKLADAGIATPRPVACIENRWGPLRRDSFLMYPYVDGRTLRSYFSGEAKESPTIAENLWGQLNDLWRRLGELQASLADTNTGNFIVAPSGQLWVIDLDRACFHTSPRSAAKYQAMGWKQLLRSAAKC
jgi:hypothetical protein